MLEVLKAIGVVLGVLVALLAIVGGVWGGVKVIFTVGAIWRGVQQLGTDVARVEKKVDDNHVEAKHEIAAVRSKLDSVVEEVAEQRGVAKSHVALANVATLGGKR